MAEQPTPKSNGRKMIIREREYDLLSWHGLKTVISLLIAVVTVVAAVLTVYYTAEASQNERLAGYRTEVVRIQECQTNQEKKIDKAFDKFEHTLTAQGEILRDTRDTVIKLHTTQQIIRESNDKLSGSVEKLAEEVKRLQPR